MWKGAWRGKRRDSSDEREGLCPRLSLSLLSPLRIAGRLQARLTLVREEQKALADGLSALRHLCVLGGGRSGEGRWRVPVKVRAGGRKPGLSHFFVLQPLSRARAPNQRAGRDPSRRDAYRHVARLELVWVHDDDDGLDLAGRGPLSLSLSPGAGTRKGEHARCCCCCCREGLGGRKREQRGFGGGGWSD